MQTIAHQSDIICTQFGLRTFKHVKMQARDFNYKIKWNFSNNFGAPRIAERPSTHFIPLPFRCCCFIGCFPFYRFAARLESFRSVTESHNSQRFSFINRIFIEFYLNFYFILFYSFTFYHLSYFNFN